MTDEKTVQNLKPFYSPKKIEVIPLSVLVLGLEEGINGILIRLFGVSIKD